jgi:hypothetical protein
VEPLEDRNLLAAPALNAPATADSAQEKSEYATPQPATDTATAHATTVSQNTYDQIDWVRTPRTTTTTSTSSQAAPDNGAFVEAVRAQRKGPDQPAFPSSAGPGQADALSGNEVLPLPVPPPTLTLANGTGFGGAAPAESNGPTDFAGLFATELVPLVRLPDEVPLRGLESAAVFSGGLDDLSPRLGPVQEGSLSGSRDLADLRGRVGDFFAQLRSLETVPQEAGSPLGLAPWVMAAATAVAVWELSRRRWRRPALLGIPSGDTTESLSWVHGPGPSSLSTEEMR